MPNMAAGGLHWRRFVVQWALMDRGCGVDARLQ